MACANIIHASPTPQVSLSGNSIQSRNSWNLTGGAANDFLVTEYGHNINRLAAVAVHFRSASELNFLEKPVPKADARRLQERILDVPDLADRSLDDLEDLVEDIAKQQVRKFGDRLKDTSSVAYYGTITASAATLGVYGYLNGSKQLKKLGVNPKLKKSFYDDHLTFKVSPVWAANFTSIGLDASIATAWHSNNYGSLQGEISFSDIGAKDISVNYQLNKPMKGLSLNAHGRYEFQTERAFTGVSLQYQAVERVDVSVSASVDSQGESLVGVGITMRL